jgi:cobaltochelatase CobT
LNALRASNRIRKILATEKLHNTCVTLLIDHSGSMHGEKMLIAAAAAEAAADFLSNLEISFEILGFTTVSWRGGKSRARWNWRGSPRHPGRLCDLLHIIYHSADDLSPRTGAWSLRQMLRPGLHKENVDGEAIEWAVTRLTERPETRKVLIVLSDGAPVDDSTLMANSPGYLNADLKDVLNRVARDGDVTIAALDICFSIERYYASYQRANSPDEIGTALLSLLEAGITQ